MNLGKILPFATGALLVWEFPLWAKAIVQRDWVGFAILSVACGFRILYLAIDIDVEHRIFPSGALHIAKVVTLYLFFLCVCILVMFMVYESATRSLSETFVQWVHVEGYFGVMVVTIKDSLFEWNRCPVEVTKRTMIKLLQGYALFVYVINVPIIVEAMSLGTPWKHKDADWNRSNLLVMFYSTFQEVQMWFILGFIVTNSMCTMRLKWFIRMLSRAYVVVWLWIYMCMMEKWSIVMLVGLGIQAFTSFVLSMLAIQIVEEETQEAAAVAVEQTPLMYFPVMRTPAYGTTVIRPTVIEHL